MNEKQLELVVGSLLHDYGKLLYRYNDGRNHSTSGYEHIRSIDAFRENQGVLDCIKYHHASMIKNAKLKNDNICYITYIADNIASASDRRSKEQTDEKGFVREAPFESVFNVLNGNSQNYVYEPSQLKDKPEFPTNDNINYNDNFYSKIVAETDNALKGIELNEKYVNSLISLLKLNLSFIPSSTQTGELVDISLYDHLKLTAGFACCIEQYLDEKNITDYKAELFDNAENFYGKKVFLIYSVDFSGIQQFIYNISSKSALKGLRSRSFYLEILMEVFVDEILERLNLSRANVLYTGGGHTYLLLPNTEKVKKETEKTIDELNKWFIETFDNSLYAAQGYSECSANELKNAPYGSYNEIFSNVSRMISEKKSHRYTADDLRKLNQPKENDHSRECVICNRTGHLNKNNYCEICDELIELSNMILDKNSLFVIVNENYSCTKVVLPFGYFLTVKSPEDLKKIINDNCYVKSYSKNKGYTGKNVSEDLWIGNYAKHTHFETLVNNAKGIKRLGVIRADVDNLGQSFVSGFSHTGGGKYETITRTSIFSRKLSEFFKYHINYILSHGEYQLFDDGNIERNAAIVYSGGDDLFIVGGWDDIICFAVDLHNVLKKYTQNTLTISAGIGIYHEKYPIYSFASDSEELEEKSKNYSDSKQKKNAVTLFDDENSYSWDDFIEKVLGEKLKVLKEFISGNDSHGKALLYKMLDLIRDKREDRLNIARLGYLLSRTEPKNKNKESLEKYKMFEQKIYRWINDENDCRQLVTAIYIYIYMNREDDKK